jgi:hypothetical protein
MEEENVWDLPEETKDEIINKIQALAWDIRNDWTDPRGECRKIVELCSKLKTL